ncbi:large subunit ribosomal protein L16 [Mycoplasmoides fastidiosum]|uniref:Large ribosomal subunit protein uL16 n=1 Tax=Mycoplasmoides fastidiosum TaxID=92758 RepID=A0ABU0LY46_9BACT|nr:50S ribosomal protein L16 [Mycoplasmoides fastidiosum]MDQ0513627.1 large subunit ribosomal protein L16 [Mycoplasmoides fastidiosum]UUD37952.1 50S ribosomal protein L16 [Mycoplasmoides fastidiosum]
MLQPKKVKYRKPHKVSFEGPAKGNSYVAFGTYGLAAQSGAWINARQIEAARIVISKKLGKTGKMWIRIFPHMSLTKKPLEVRMGSGKGAPDRFVAVVKQDTIMFEVAGVPEAVAKLALKLAGNKLPIKTRVVQRQIKPAAVGTKPEVNAE